jgi:SET domain-containing protein
MPYTFTYKQSNDDVFKCRLEKYQCEYTNEKTGKRCKRHQYIGFPLCYQHLAMEAHLRIARATNIEHGKGLFAYNGTNNDEVVFKKDQRIIQYNGEVVNKEELDRRYGGTNADTAPYAFQANKNSFIDSSCLRSAGSLANHRPLRTANAKLYFYSGDKKAYIKATKNIRNNEEIFVNYGPNYRFMDNHETKYIRP